MFQIKGEGLFVGETYITEGMKVSDRLKKNGFNVVPDFKPFQTPKTFKFTFEAGADNQSPLII